MTRLQAFVLGWLLGTAFTCLGAVLAAATT